MKVTFGVRLINYVNVNKPNAENKTKTNYCVLFSLSVTIDWNRLHSL